MICDSCSGGQSEENEDIQGARFLSTEDVPSQCKLPGNQTCHTPSRLEMYTGWITCQGTGDVVSAAYVQGAGLTPGRVTSKSLRCLGSTSESNKFVR